MVKSVRHIRAANLKLLEEYNQDPKLKAKNWLN